MIFLIEYERANRRIVTSASFLDTERKRAEKARLEIELTLHESGVGHEVVLLEARDEDALRETHRRYFQSAGELLNAAQLTPR